MHSTQTSDDQMLLRSSRREWRRLAALTTGHFASDLYQGAIPAFLPYLVLLHDYSLTSASLIVLAFTATASITQPGFGWLADRRDMTWLAPLGLVVCGGAFTLLMSAPSLPLLMLLAAICGCGNAAFHPQAARDVARLFDHRPSFAISIFMVGGQGGFALGPLVIAIVLNSIGLRGAPLLLLPALIAAGLIFQRRTSGLHTVGEVDRSSSGIATGANDWSAFGILMALVFIWSILSVGTYTYLGLYWTLGLGQSTSSANVALTTMLIAGVFGMVGGSWLADRYSAMSVVGGGFALCIVSLIFLLMASNLLSAQVATVALGISVYAPFAVMVVLGQRFLPRSTGMASGITMGMSMSIGGLVAPGLGVIADGYGFPVLFAVLAIGASIACMLSAWLVRIRETR